MKKTLLHHLVAIAIFIAISLVYCSPLFQGKQVKQDDITRFNGMSKEIVDFRDKTGKEPLWTNSMFGGMPAYQISVLYPSNLIQYVHRVVRLGLPHPAGMLFLYLVGFYFLLITLKFDVRMSTIGAFAYALSSYFFIIIEAGHNSKADAIGYFAPVVAGVLMTYRGKIWLGGIVTALALALQLYVNHLQITYYLFLTLLVLGIVELVKAIKEKQYLPFLKSTGVLIIASGLAVTPNIGNILLTYDYGKYTTRGQSELNEKKVSTGLDKDYALGWSYGVGETMTLLIPNFYGGSSSGELSTSSETYKTLIEKSVPVSQAKQIIKNAPMYWGDQPFTSGPVYAGAIVCFLFVLGLFVLKGDYKWWLLLATILSIMLSWGKNFQWFTDIFFDHFPGYNKFRTVSMILVIAEFTMPLLALLGLKKIMEGEIPVKQIKKYLLYSFYIVGGLTFFFVLLPGALFDFVSSSDEQMKTSGYPDWIIEAFRADRGNILRSDAFRSFAFIVLAGGVIWLFVINKLKKEYAYWGMALLILTDMWVVDKRYLNNDSFVAKTKIEKPYLPTQADMQILQDKDLDYRVLNLSVSTFNDANTSYFHKSVGGYHGAKLKRYQELIEYQISKNNMSVLNMLNTRYIIQLDEKTQQQLVHRNPLALGNAWFVQEFKLVANADSEMNALTNFNPAQTAIVDKRFENELSNLKINVDSTASIKLVGYEPNVLTYQSKASTEQLAVFSEIYYQPGWNAYIDGKLMQHFRANYVLRAIRVSAGEHKIEFKFEPQVYYTGEKISLAGSILLLLLAGGVIFMEVKKVKSV